MLCRSTVVQEVELLRKLTFGKLEEKGSVAAVPSYGSFRLLGY